MKKIFFILFRLVFGFSTTAFSASGPSGNEDVVAYTVPSLGATAGANPDIGGLLNGDPFMTGTMVAGGNNEKGFTITLTSTLIYTKSATTGLTVIDPVVSSGALTAATKGHNQVFQIACGHVLDDSNNTILTSGTLTAQGTANTTPGNITCSYTSPVRAVLATDTFLLTIHTTANTSMISGAYAASVTIAVADNS
jgi:hypothetical protein